MNDTSDNKKGCERPLQASETDFRKHLWLLAVIMGVIIIAALVSWLHS